MRVLTVTPSRKGIQTIIEAVCDLTNGKGSGLFFFIDRETLGASNPLDIEWMSGNGERVRLSARCLLDVILRARLQCTAHAAARVRV